MGARRRLDEHSTAERSGVSAVFTRFAETALPFAAALWRKYEADEVSLRAMSLTYTTILSMVPFLAVAFSVLKAFGVQNQIEPTLVGALSPLGAGAAEISQRVVDFVNNLRVGVLGTLGVVGLFYTAVSLVGTIENSLNHIWSVRQGRTLATKFRDYLSVILLGPVLMFSALALTASAQSHTLVQRALEIAPFLTVVATRIMPHVILAAGFTLLYKYVPNARVSWRAALVGGVVAGVGWKLAGTAFATFVAGSGRYAAIYSSFAILILFLVWLYVSWIIVLVGGQVAYICQYPYLASLSRTLDAQAEHERRALMALRLITTRHLRGEPPYQLAELGISLRVPLRWLEELTDRFTKHGVLLRSSEPPGVALARPPEDIPVLEILETLRGAETTTPGPDTPASVIDIMRRRHQALDQALRDVTLRSLASKAVDPSDEGAATA